MDVKGLRKYMKQNARKWGEIRDRLSGAMSVAPDPGSFVLDAMGKGSHSKQNLIRTVAENQLFGGSNLVFEFGLVLTSSQPVPLLKAHLKESE
ncbi:hypothetical protein NC652_004874 [Populus alba x Populus x berolinensis]|nr:hypothetical protein NC652_004874 [Populus alba x Populus x berolinensis]